MTTTRATDRPFHLAGNFRPVTDELTAIDLPVTGHIPTELDGTFVRNGPNPVDGTSSHWFLGNGMVHGVRLQDGRASWYRNRYVRTKRLSDGAPSIGPDGTRDFTAGAANTHVIRHGGRILALDEASFPYELTPELETVGPFDFDQRLRGPMTAHPKICPLTGELHFFGYDFAPPYLTYHVADATGTLITSRVVDVPGATMMHDFNLTEHFVVFMDLPAVFDLELALAGTMPYRFDPTYGARFGVLRRDDPHGVVRWFDIEPCYVFHQMNAHDDGTSITIDAVRHADLWFEGEATPGNLWRWGIDLAAGTVTEQQLDDLPCEFPASTTGSSAGQRDTAGSRRPHDITPTASVRSPCTTSSMRTRSASIPSGRNGSPVKQCSLPRTPTPTTAGYSPMCTTHAPTAAISSSSTSTRSTTSRSQPCTFPAAFRSASMARGSRTPQQLTRWTNADVAFPPDAICVAHCSN